MSRNRVYLSGYYGMLNTGDDALMLAAAMGAQQWLDASDLTISSYRPLEMPGFGAFRKRLSDPQRFRGENRLRNYWQGLRNQRVIWGGGSVLHSLQDITIKRHMIQLTGSGIGLGVSLGPFENTHAEKACAKWLNECEFVGLRDKASFDLARALAPNANTALTFDLAPQLLLNPELDLPLDYQRAGICLCLCPVERLSGDKGREQKRLAELAKLLVEIYRQTGEPITLLDFNGHITLGDAQVHRDLQALLPADVPVEYLPYQSNPLRVLQKLANFKLIISMRLHAAIFGFLVKTPVFSINYHQKCEGWGDQIKLARHLQLPLHKVLKQGAAWQSQFSEQLVDTVTSGLEEGFMAPELEPTQALTMSLANWRLGNEIIQHCIGRYSAVQ